MTKNWSIEIPEELIVESNYYLVNGKKYWRVTRVKSIINQPGLNLWRARVGDKESRRIMKVRSEYGSRFHKLAELLVQDKPISGDYSEEMKADIESFIKFKTNCVVETEAVEQKLISNILGVAGTADIIMRYKSCNRFLKKKTESKFDKPSLVIGDWKTATAIFDEYWLQIAAYAFIFEELTGVEVDGGVIAQFRDGKIHVEEKTKEELKCYFEAFKNCIELFIFEQEGC